MPEIILNLHVHTNLSDGHATYQVIADAAAKAEIDAVIITDHNVLPEGLEGYYSSVGRKVLLLTGEEIHDQGRDPQKDHLLVFNTNREISDLGPDTQSLLSRVRELGGLSFIAHPIDEEFSAIGEPNISWEKWNLKGFTGIELWNGFSEIKSVSKTYLDAAFYSFFPQFLAHGPLPDTLALWDRLLSENPRCVGVGGADAHNLQKHLGPFRKSVFPYEYHFKAINNHILLPSELSGNLIKDKAMIYKAIKQGNLFIGYDLPFQTAGFFFRAQGQGKTVTIGDEISAKGGVTLQIRTPRSCKILMIYNGKVVQKWKGQQSCTFVANKPGYYRVESYLEYLGSRRGWIFSNPIYLV